MSVKSVYACMYREVGADFYRAQGVLTALTPFCYCVCRERTGKEKLRNWIFTHIEKKA